MGVISIAIGIINQLIIGGAPPCNQVCPCCSFPMFFFSLDIFPSTRGAPDIIRRDAHGLQEIVQLRGLHRHAQVLEMDKNHGKTRGK